MKVLILLTFLLTFSPPAWAQDRLAAGLFASAATADWITTHQRLTSGRGGGETNPALTWLVDKPTALVTVGAAMDVAGFTAWWHYTRDHRRMRTIGLLAATAGRLYFVRGNIRHDSRPPCGGPFRPC